MRWAILGAIAVACLTLHDAGAARRPASTRWYGSRPHTPLVTTDARGIHEAGLSACLPWSRLGSRWRAVDAYGQVVGRAEVRARDRYDVTGCEEVQLAPLAGGAGVGLYASEGGAWTAPRSAAWTPSRAEQASLARLVEPLQRAVDPAAAGGPSPTLFFRSHGEDKGHAVVGGRLLIVASLDRGGHWRLAYFENAATSPGLPANAFRPLAVFDMDGDSVPEIIYHLDAGDAFNDVVLEHENGGWHPVAENIHGATA